MNFWLLFVALLSAFTLSSCGDSNENEDDIYININGGGGDSGADDLKTDPAKLIGTWENIITFTYDDPAPDGLKRIVTTLVFNNDGKTMEQKCKWDYIGIPDEQNITYCEYTYDGVEEIITITNATLVYDDGSTIQLGGTQTSLYIRDNTLYYLGNVFTRNRS